MRQEELEKRKKKLREALNEAEQDATVVKLGDASIASPFTYKLSSIAAGNCATLRALRIYYLRPNCLERVWIVMHRLYE